MPEMRAARGLSSETMDGWQQEMTSAKLPRCGKLTANQKRTYLMTSSVAMVRTAAFTSLTFFHQLDLIVAHVNAVFMSKVSFKFFQD